MGKHRRPGPPNQPYRAVPRVNADDPLAAYNKRRRPPMDVYRRHRPVHGGAGHLRRDCKSFGVTPDQGRCTDGQ
ncbi:hypothetical protein C0216_31205 (plasmid) [Streptomyces globosus]|uniref:Uncharacterized protein n=1 Tax=Streptomyces globosus TaxID=68209 RepID=A0A344U1C5_9ACTN|nr:hypothetical protein C0216_15625 [Streptomyces globosus]AXE27983.1 hypothetical protein C0216_31205 [Streptomyces globosus]